MRSSNKRSRNKNHNNNNNRRHNPSNVVNRVFDSSGPEGKVRGTPQQIIDKYQGLARDAQLSGDRIAHENFLQHSEHYSRMLSEAMREMAERKEAQAAQQQNQQPTSRQISKSKIMLHLCRLLAKKVLSNPQSKLHQTKMYFPGQSEDSDLVATPESASEKKQPKRAPRKPAVKKEIPISAEEAPASDEPSNAEASG